MTQSLFQTPQQELADESWRLALRQKSDKEKYQDVQNKILKEIFEQFAQLKQRRIYKMDNQNNLIDYEKEAGILNDQKQANYWNPKEGKFEVIALSELSKFQQTDKDGTVKEKAKVLIEVAGQQFIWTMGVGQTKASLYGQLVSFALEHEKKLLGKKFTVVIKNDGKKRDFTIV